MSEYNLTHLKQLEAESIHIMREVAAEFENPVMLYSVGKDSSVMVHLAMKAFHPAKPPFPLMHVDTSWKFREMIAFRDNWAKKELGLDLIVHINQEGVAQGVGPFTHGSAVHTDIMKTQSLRQALNKHRFDAAFGGARRDEEKSRAAAAGHSHRPVGEAIGRITRADDQSRPNDQCAPRHRRLCRPLAAGFERAVVLRHLLRVRLGHGDRLGGLVEAWLVQLGERGHRRHEQVALAVIGEQPGARLDLSREVAGGVDHDVELSPFELGQVVVAIAPQLLQIREQMRVGLPPIEQGDLVARSLGGLDDVRTQKSGAAEDEQRRLALRGVRRGAAGFGRDGRARIFVGAARGGEGRRHHADREAAPGQIGRCGHRRRLDTRSGATVSSFELPRVR